MGAWVVLRLGWIEGEQCVEGGVRRKKRSFRSGETDGGRRKRRDSEPQVELGRRTAVDQMHSVARRGGWCGKRSVEKRRQV